MPSKKTKGALPEAVPDITLSHEWPSAVSDALSAGRRVLEIRTDILARSLQDIQRLQSVLMQKVDLILQHLGGTIGQAPASTHKRKSTSTDAEVDLYVRLSDGYAKDKFMVKQTSNTLPRARAWRTWVLDQRGESESSELANMDGDTLVDVFLSVGLQLKGKSQTSRAKRARISKGAAVAEKDVGISASEESEAIESDQAESSEDAEGWKEESDHESEVGPSMSTKRTKASLA